MKTLKENLLIAHHIGLKTSVVFGLLLLFLNTVSAGWLVVVLLMYLVAAGLVATAPFIFGEELMAAAATAMAGLSWRVLFVSQPTAVFQQVSQPTIVGQPPKPQPVIWREQPWLSTGPVLVIKTAAPFLLFGQAPLRIP